jgi:NADP-dependent 3-hydroxy acid dehydrogenase YdfG
MELNKKVAIVTGVSKGIGEALCKALLAEGCMVYGLGMNAPPIQDQNLQFIPTDIRSFAAVESAIQTIVKQEQHVHILINNAGLGYFANVEDLPLEQWDQMFQTNINGMFYTCKLTVPVMKQQGIGHIVNISSTAGLEGMPMVSGYCATKWAVKGFSESLWRELRDHKIKVTCVYPGSVKTDFFRNSPGIQAHDYMLMPSDVAELILHALKAPDNCHQVNLEIRPLQPKGPKTKQ